MENNVVCKSNCDSIYKRYKCKLKLELNPSIVILEKCLQTNEIKTKPVGWCFWYHRHGEILDWALNDHSLQLLAVWL